MLENIRTRLNHLPRSLKRAILVVFDFVALAFCVWLAYSLRLNTRFIPNDGQLVVMLLAPMTALPVFIRMGLYRAVIRYLPERAVWTIVQATFLATLIWMAIVYLTAMTGIVGAPRSVPVLYWLLSMVVVAGSRFAAKRFLIDREMDAPQRVRVLVYGAREAGVHLAAALRAHGGRNVVGFIDDDPNLHGHDVSGIRVYSPVRVADLVRSREVKEVILSLPSIAPERRQAIYTELAGLGVNIRALPSITDLASGKYLINQVREIDIDDLLGRSSVAPDEELIKKMIEGRVIFVSGAGGSIGSELSRLIARHGPARLVLLEANEHALYQIDRELRRTGKVELVPVLGSVEDDRLMHEVLAAQKVEVVFHAAAHKHVPLLESNVIEGVANNVFGTRNLVHAAFETGVKNFVLISTDKAVRPSSVMGATKRWAELIVRDYGARAAAKKTGQIFCAVRFGNVLGSNGSVVPLFREQIAHGGPITLTDERMTRYFMSIHEAAELIVQAGALSEGNDLFMLEMGNPVRIRDLAENMIHLAGLTVRSPQNPSGDIAIAITGIRRGEKLTEELFYQPQMARPTRHPKILRVRTQGVETPPMDKAVSGLEARVRSHDVPSVKATLFELVTDK
ncbi:MAG: polysaccharide biosynthesis protein [Hyphomicrobiaceae bacterium]|nr:polysaccharide biosynthesis protein [Hyphomicrobiaceae bacterium]